MMENPSIDSNRLILLEIPVKTEHNDKDKQLEQILKEWIDMPSLSTLGMRESID